MIEAAVQVVKKRERDKLILASEKSQRRNYCTVIVLSFYKYACVKGIT